MPFAWMLNAVWVAVAATVLVFVISRLLKARLPFSLIGSIVLTLAG